MQKTLTKETLTALTALSKENLVALIKNLSAEIPAVTAKLNNKFLIKKAVKNDDPNLLLEKIEKLLEEDYSFEVSHAITELLTTLNSLECYDDVLFLGERLFEWIEGEYVDNDYPEDFDFADVIETLEVALEKSKISKEEKKKYAIQFKKLDDHHYLYVNLDKYIKA